MKKLIALFLVLTPSVVFAQTIPLSGWPDVIYCTDSDSNVYAIHQTAMPGVAGFSDPLKLYEYSTPYADRTNQGMARATWLFLSDGTFSQSDTLTDCESQSVDQLLIAKKAWYFVRSSTPKEMPDVIAKRKIANESVANSATLHDDTQLSAVVKSGKSYTVEGTVFVSATNSTPDAKIAFTAPSGSELAIGYTSTAAAGATGELEVSGTASDRIPLPANTKVPVHIEGTVVAGADGTLQLRWAQFTSNAATLTVGKGSYLKVSEIQ